MKSITNGSHVKSLALHKFSLKRLCFVLAISFVVYDVAGQENSIGGGNIQGCGGFLVDSGFSAGDYGSNEDLTATICAMAPETILSLYWTVCDLGNGDYIEIFDGNSTASTLIGTYFSNELQSQDITSTNVSGCLTVHFVSDNAIEGNFGAEISCGLPCVRPISAITTNQEPMPLYVCPGEVITFDGSGTQFSNGSSLSTFNWNFDDGATNNSSWPSVSHSFDIPGGYKVQLSVTDNNGCFNTNLNDYIVFVSTPPNFNLITDITDLCSGGEAFLGVTNLALDSVFSSDSLSQWISNPWTDFPDNFNENGYQVEDDQTSCYDVYFTYNSFPAGETIDNVSDIVNAYINFEHSFMQDLVISVICPSGQSVILHQQLGGGTDIGESVIGVDGTAGVGYDYFWAPDASNGTWGTNADGVQLPSGTYESQQPFTNLIGCPLNGTWTLEFCDMWGGDDGFLFNYGMTFNPNFYGEILNFTPQYGPGCDSTFWVGPGISSESAGCDYINVTLNDPGTYTYVYTAINNFGCSYDTTISITVDTAPTVNAGIDLTFDCTNPSIALEGGFNEIPPSSCNDVGGIFNYTYDNSENITWTFCPDAGSTESTLMTFTFISGEMEPNFENLLVFDGPDSTSPILMDWNDGDATGLSWTANNATGCLTIQFTSDFIISAADGAFQPWTYEVGCEQIAPYFTWSWSPSQYLADPNAPTTDVEGLQQTQTFTLTGYPTGQPNCFSTDQVTVFVSSDLSIDVEEFYKECPGDTASVLAPQISGGTAPFITKWVSETGEEYFTETIQVPVGSIKEYCSIVEDACGISDTACTEISAYPQISATFQVDNQLGCDPHYALMTSDYIEFQHVETMTWHFGDGESGSTLASANHEYNAHGTFFPWLVIVDEHGCTFQDTLDTPIRVWPTPIAQFSVDPEIAILPNTTFHFENSTINGESYLWTIDQYGISTNTDTSWTFPSETVGTYLISLLAYNQYGCRDSTFMQIMVQDEIDIYIPNAFTPDYDGINDVWQLKGKGFEKDAFRAEVFNRWGEKLYESTDPEDAWTGNYHNGENFVPDGVYFYKITIRDIQNDVNHLYEGHITVVR